MSAGDGTAPADRRADGGGGRRLAGRYRVVAELGRGGMGVVARAVDEVLGREVAVKELRAFSDASDAELAALRGRMRREARAAARIRHPGVVVVHDVAEQDGRPVIVMELVDGPSLDDVVREEGPLEPRRAAAIGAEVLDALAAAHRAGVLHRDVKPGNVLLDKSGRVVLTDFGIAAVEEPEQPGGSLTRSGEIVGSLDYLAPERARGERPGTPSDVWALGATLYAAVEGVSPFRRDSTWSTLNAIVVEPLPEPRGAGPLKPVLRAMLAKEAAARPDAERCRDLLRAVAAGVPAAESGPLPVPRSEPGTAPTVAPAPADRPPGAGEPPGAEESHAIAASETARRRRVRNVAVAAAAAAVVLAGGGTAWWLTGGERRPARRPAGGGRPHRAGTPPRSGRRRPRPLGRLGVRDGPGRPDARRRAVAVGRNRTPVRLPGPARPVRERGRRKGRRGRLAERHGSLREPRLPALRRCHDHVHGVGGRQVLRRARR